MLLGHKVGTKVDQTYEGDARCDPELREWLEKWANYLLKASPSSEKLLNASPSSENVVSLITGRRASNA